MHDGPFHAEFSKRIRIGRATPSCKKCPVTHAEKTKGFERGTLKKDTAEHMDQNQNSNKYNATSKTEPKLKKKYKTHHTDWKLKHDTVAAHFF